MNLSIVKINLNHLIYALRICKTNQYPKLNSSYLLTRLQNSITIFKSHLMDLLHILSLDVDDFNSVLLFKTLAKS